MYVGALLALLEGREGKGEGERNREDGRVLLNFMSSSKARAS